MKIYFILLAVMLSGCSLIPASKFLPPALIEIKTEVAEKWEKQCTNYFFWRTPTVIAYRGGRQADLVAPHEWCRIESRNILRDRLPFDYVSSIEND